jgi:hypothetical protein
MIRLDILYTSSEVEVIIKIKNNVSNIGIV